MVWCSAKVSGFRERYFLISEYWLLLKGLGEDNVGREYRMRRLSLKDSGRTLVLNISVYQNHLGGLVSPRLLSLSPQGLVLYVWVRPIIFISNNLLTDAAAGPETIPRERLI